jgi:hypothetical protein
VLSIYGELRAAIGLTVAPEEPRAASTAVLRSKSRAAEYSTEPLGRAHASPTLCTNIDCLVSEARQYYSQHLHSFRKIVFYMIIGFLNYKMRVYPRMYLRRFLAKLRPHRVAGVTTTPSPIVLSNEIQPCSICRGRSMLLGRSVVDSSKARNDASCQQFIDFFHKLGYIEQKIYLCQSCGMYS